VSSGAIEKRGIKQKIVNLILSGKHWKNAITQHPPYVVATLGPPKAEGVGLAS
jgi:hypothetical protein